MVLHPLVTVAHASLDFDLNRVTPGGDPRDGVLIKQITECSLSLFLKEYSISVVSGKLQSNISAIGYGREYLLWNANKSYLDYCWMPDNGSTDTPLEWLLQENICANTSEFIYCSTELVTFPHGAITRIIYTSELAG